MKLKVYVVDLGISTRAKTWALRLGIPLLALVAGGVAFAGLPGGYADGQPLTKAILDSNFNYLQSEITALQQQSTGVPSGTVVAFAGPVVPAGWMLCDGSVQSRATYASLFAAIGTSSGSGDGATTFNVPDYRGMFLRGVDIGDTNTRDPDTGSRSASAPGGNTGNLVGSVEGASLSSHNHTLHDPGYTVPLNDGNGFMTQNANGTQVCAAAGAGWCIGLSSNSPAQTNISIDPAGGSETRPINVFVNYIIKL